MQFSITSRPRKFSDVFGQPSAVKELSTRALKNNWPSAMLLKGPSGTGKTSCAQLIAMILNCRELDPEGNPCQKCPSCRSIIDERFDRDTHQLDGGSSSKDEVVDFGQMTQIAPMYDKNAVFIIEEADQLSPAAKNSLLKTLEKPLSGVYFILLSMVNTGISPAIQSRCQVFKFNPFFNKDLLLGMRKILIDNSLWNIPTIPKEFYLQGLTALADAAQGNFRMAIQYLEKCLVGEYWTPEAIKTNLGILDTVTVYESIEKLLALDPKFLVELESLDVAEFFNIAYLALSQASAYRFTKTCNNEYYEAQTRSIAGNPNLFDLLKVFDELQTYTYLKKSLVISKFSQYFASKRIRKIVEAT